MSNPTRDLLIEIGTEELPPTTILSLGKFFAENTWKSLSDMGIGRHGNLSFFTSPRRLALYIEKLEYSAGIIHTKKWGPPASAAYDKEGNPTPAAIGFASNCGVELSQIQLLDSDKGKRLYFESKEPGPSVPQILPDIIQEVLLKLPISKRMRWGSGDAEFVRPVHSVVVLFGNDVIECEILGVKSGRTTRGHRHHHPDLIEIKTASDYVKTLKKAKIWLNGTDSTLQKEISAQAGKLASEVKGIAINSEPDSDLVAEVAALVEWPVAIRGAFDPEFLALPEEILISTLEGQQRYFPVRDKQSGKLLPYFITIANIESKNPDEIRHGNERVIVPRLTDAMFFWDTDRKTKLVDRHSCLDGIVFQKKLGTIGDKMRRVSELAAKIAESIGGDPALAKRAALLAKSDLVTNLVGEFPELQGIMGNYLARQDGESDAVAAAIEEHYLPRFAGDVLPQTKTGQALAIADKLDTIVGIFGIGQAPTGDKDPFALRRAALGIIRIMSEQSLPLSLFDIVNTSYQSFAPGMINDTRTDLESFIFERARNYFIEQGYTANEVDAVLSLRPARFDHVPMQLRAVKAYAGLPEAPSLSAANKRIGNILKGLDSEPFSFDSNLLVETAEKQLASVFLSIEPEIESLFSQHDFTTMLKKLATLKEPVDTFFDKVMVMTDDQKLKHNRIGLLNKLYKMMNRIADLSRLAT